jgi:membrane associated rhomboid family serine protease
MSYYRQVAMSFFPPLTRMVKYLVLSTSAVFLLTYLPEQLFGWTDFLQWFALWPKGVTQGFEVWRLFTYLFLHATFLHILFNMLGLWMFGSELERTWGPRRFLFYYFLTGVGAGICDVLVHPSSDSITLGCSGAIYGLLLAYGVLFPDRSIFLWFFIPIKAKWFVVIWGAFEFLSAIGQPGSNVSHVAHLGGMLFGYVYLRHQKLAFGFQARYQDWRRARLRRKFDVYVRQQEKKDDAGRWIN